MFYEVFIPSTGDEGFDVTITVEAENWMTALKSGLERTGQGADSIRNVMCDIKDDNSIHVTDASSRRVFVLREVDELANEAEQSSPTNGAGERTPPTPEPANPEPAPTPEPSERMADTVKHSAPPVASKPPQRGARPPESATSPGRPERAASPPTTTPPKSIRQTGSNPPPASSSPPSAAVKAEAAAPEPAAAPSEPSVPAADDGGSLEEHSWQSEDERMRIGSSTFESLRRDEPEPRVVRETRSPSGQRPAVDIGRASEAVSQNVLEEVFLEIQQIHEQEMIMEEVINFVMDLSMEKIDAEAGSIMFADVNGQELYFATARGPKAHDVMDFRVPMSKGIVGFCAREGVSLAISDAPNDPRFYKEVSEALGYETTSVCCAPIQFEGRVYGAIELLNKEGSAFTNTEVNVLTYIGRQLAKFVHDLIMSREKLE